MSVLDDTPIGLSLSPHSQIGSCVACRYVLYVYERTRTLFDLIRLVHATSTVTLTLNQLLRRAQSLFTISSFGKNIIVMYMHGFYSYLFHFIQFIYFFSRAAVSFIFQCML